MEWLLQLDKPESMQISLASKFVTDIYESNGKFHPGAALVGAGGAGVGKNLHFVKLQTENVTTANRAHSDMNKIHG